MNVRVFANTSSLALTERRDGGAFVPPVSAAYSDLHWRLKLLESLEGAPVFDGRELLSLSARIGWPDRAPVSGTHTLSITYDAATATLAPLAHSATAAQIATAINAALAVDGAPAGLSPATVTEYEGLKKIVFADKTAQPVIVAEENSLWPPSFVDVDETEFDEGWAYILQLRQAPVAETAVFSQEVPGAPEVSRLQAGQTVDGLAINEIQKLAIPPSFAGGAFRLLRGGTKSAPIPVPTDLETLRSRLASIAPQGGGFEVTGLEDGVYIEFVSDLAGEAHDLLGVEVFESPGADYFFRVSTRTDSMRALMRLANDAGEVEVPLNLTMEIADDAGSGDPQELTWIVPMRFARPISTDEHNVAADLVWNQPLSRADYLRHAPSSLLVGNRSVAPVIGDGVATSFSIDHNLAENARVATANATTDALTAVGHGYANGDPVTVANVGGALPGGLVAGTTYYVLAATEDTFQIALAPGGSAIDLTSAGTGTHTARLADGTVPGAVFVQVWRETGDREMVSPDAYAVTRPSANSVVVSGFAAVPAAGEYRVIVMTAGRPATFQGHTHPTLAETPEAKTRIEALEARVLALESGSVPGQAPAAVRAAIGARTRPLGIVWRVPRARVVPDRPESLLSWRITAEDLGTLPTRAPRLLPAVHDAETEALPATLPTPASSLAGRVFSAASARLDFPGGLRAGDFAACDGREWYRVIRSGSSTSYFPAIFETTLFEVAVNAGEMPARTSLELLCGLEMVVAMLDRRARDRRSACQWTLVLEAGVPTADASPATPALNLATAFANTITLLSQRIILTEIPTQVRFGCRIARDGAGAITARSTLYATEAETTPPPSVPFALRARLIEFDTENDPADARGVVAVRGLDVGLDGDSDPALGKLAIS